MRASSTWLKNVCTDQHNIMKTEVCDQNQYWSTPTISQLKSWKRQDLCKVTDFRAGKNEVGIIHFTQPVDLSNVELDSLLGGLILFENGSCTVYPVESDTPPMGQGLNVPATIELYNLEPLVQTVPLQRLLLKLRSVKYTQFINYNAILGSWRFTVQHFTRYEFPTIEDEDETMLDVVENAVEKFVENPSVLAATATAAIAILDHLENEETNDADERHVENHHQVTDKEVVTGDSGNKKRPHEDMSSSMVNGDTDLEFYDAVSDNFSFFQARTSFDNDTPMKTAQRPNKYVRVGYTESIAYKYSDLLVDAGLTMGRSFRTSWGLGDVIAHSGKIHSQAGLTENGTTLHPEVMSADVSLQNVHHTSPLNFDVAQSLELLKNMLNQTKIMSEKGVPRAKLNANATFGNLLQSQWNDMPSHVLLVLKLCQGLYDPVEESSTTMTDVEAVRKKRFNKWLEDAVTPEMDRELEQHAADGNAAATVFTYLTGHRIKEACNAALENRDNRLATLLPQVITGSETFRNYIKSQLRLWKDYQYEGMISNDYRKVYELMSGNVGLTQGMNGAVGDSDRVLVSEGLDWKRTLGLYIWYQSSPDASLEEGLHKYLEATIHRELALRVAEPTPWYLGPHAVSSRRDMLFQIIKMYAQGSSDIDTALDPLGITSDSLDYRMTWCLYIMLSKTFNVDTGSDKVTASFASQLEAMGLWHWAIYVQLFLKARNSRQIAIQDILARHIELDTTDEQEAFLKDQLHIPVAWIEEAKALRAAYNGDLHAQVNALIKAGKHSDAHHLIVEKLAPQAIKIDDLSSIEDALTKIDSSKVFDWQQCGQLFLSYIQLIKSAEQGDGNVISELKDKVSHDLRNLKIQNDSRPKRNVSLAECISQMAVRCALQPSR